MGVAVTTWGRMGARVSALPPNVEPKPSQCPLNGFGESGNVEHLQVPNNQQKVQGSWGHEATDTASVFFWGGGLQRLGVDPPLSSSHAGLTAFIASSVPFVFVSLGQSNPVLLPHLPESGKGWLLSMGSRAISPRHRSGLSPEHCMHACSTLVSTDLCVCLLVSAPFSHIPPPPPRASHPPPLQEQEWNSQI